MEHQMLRTWTEQQCQVLFKQSLLNRMSEAALPIPRSALNAPLRVDPNDRFPRDARRLTLLHCTLLTVEKKLQLVCDRTII